MINVVIKGKLIEEISLYRQLKAKIVEGCAFVIPFTREIYLPDVENSNRWAMLHQDRKLGVFVYRNFEELIVDLVERDIRPEQIAILRDDQIDIDVVITE